MLIDHLEEAVWMGTLLIILFGATWVILWELYRRLRDQIIHRSTRADGAALILVGEHIPQFEITVCKQRVVVAPGDQLDIG